VLVVSAGFVHASETPGQKCAVAKMKAAAKKLGGKVKCIEKAVSKGAAVDTTCLMAADTKFTAAILKAESGSGCAVSGDGPTFEALVDHDANAFQGLAAPTTPVCCFDGAGECWYGATSGDCGPFSAGAAGTVCDGATGGCVATASQTPGNCCSNPTTPLIATVTSNCAAGTEFSDSTICTGGGGQFYQNSLCPPVADVPGGPNGPTCIQF
jgi:hypothetical protein